jgi:hypothetical protein
MNVLDCGSADEALAANGFAPSRRGCAQRFLRKTQ